MTRVTDDQVQHMLAWARNYGDVTEYKRVAKSGAKWLIKLALRGVSCENSGVINAEWIEKADLGDLMLGPRKQDIVPQEMVLTNREVMLLCYGLAAGGERTFPRSAYRDRWNAGEKFEPEAVVVAQ